jgi:S-DNA-T family DNA segregation ATPase FtsK/SpoIIIE
MIIATQRPIVKVITGLIKSNILCRVAFSVKTTTDSRVVLDEMGAEDLLGKGDMLYSTPADGLIRMQGALVEIGEIKQVCDYIRNNNVTDFDESIVESIKVKVEPTVDPEEAAQIARDNKEAEEEELLGRIIKYFISKEKASISSAQSKFGIGYQRAKKAVDELEERGYIGPETTGAQGREILISALEAEELFPSTD